MKRLGGAEDEDDEEDDACGEEEEEVGGLEPEELLLLEYRDLGSSERSWRGGMRGGQHICRLLACWSAEAHKVATGCDATRRVRA